ncbi:zinc finger protein 518A [Calypte anna]|uniref:zinc finger protein 518A n=1 Tax=Calypte anna TaxID=9244 RepID=UPI0011C36365|nr:zinc finger protein 518A [Calypte anna]XP_030308927.1 zinc finger protein 518A [Calypte anna]
MPSEKEPFFPDKRPINLLKHNAAMNFSTNTTFKKALVNAPLSMMTQPAILDVSLSYELKNVKIDLPKVNIPNEVLMKHEADRFRKLFQCKQQTARKSLNLVKINGSDPSCSEGSNLQSKPEVQFEGLKTAAKILNFTCTKCKDSIRYSPNDLQKHFQLLHYGELPLYPCEMCSFSANDFQSFKQHRRTHRSTLVKCELCNDEHMYTLLDLTKHFTSKHCVNGHFQCEKCGFSTKDVGTFVQHIHRHNEIPYKCGKCHHISFTKEEFQKHHLVHTSMFPFGCQYCSYKAARKDYLLKHIIALHREHLYAKEKLEKEKCEKSIVKTPAGLKLVLRRCKMGTSKKALWRRKKISDGSDKTGEKNVQVLRSVNKIQTKSEELNQCMGYMAANEEDKMIHAEKHNFMGGMLSSSTAQHNKADGGKSYGLALLKNAVHGPTVLMVKNNKIAVPANYSAKFMGFKMVDGKQHIVIKLLPTSKQNLNFLGQKADPTKDGSTTSLLQTADHYGLCSGAISHVTDQLTVKNSSVHPLTSPPFSCSAPHSGKTEVGNQNNSLFYGRSVSQTVAPCNVAVGKGLNYLPMKLDSNVPPCDEVTKLGTRGTISGGSCSPSSHPQVLPSTVTNALHYDPMKMPFFPELKMQNGGLNNGNGTNNLYYSTSVDSSNEGLLSFHNYSKMDTSDNPCSVWMSTDDKYKELLSSKAVSFPNSRRTESASSCSELMKGLKPEKIVSAQSNNNKIYGHTDMKNVSSKSHLECVGSMCFMEDQHNGQQYWDAYVHQGFENITENFQENTSDCVNSVLMPKITSVFSLQSEHAADYLSPEIKQLLQDVLKVKATTQQESHSKSNNCLKLHSDKLHSGHETGNKAFTHLKSSATACGLQRLPANVDFHLYKRELNTRCSTNEDTHCGRETQTPRTSFDSQGMDKLSRNPDVGTLLKTHRDAIITQQLVKDKTLSTTQNPSSFLPVLQEQKKPLLVQSSPSGFFVPLHLANKPGLQVVSGRSLPSTSSSDGHVTKGVPASFVLNKGPGMVLTFNGAIGTVANVPSDNSLVLGRVASREYGKITIPFSKAEGKKNSFRRLRSSCNRRACSTANDSLNSMSFKGPLVITNSSESSVKRMSSVKVLSEHQDAVIDSLESVNQQEMKQKHVYALLPDGQQAVFLKCMTPNKPVVHKHSIFQDNVHYQNCQPKKTGAMQQKLLLKSKISTSDALAETTRSVSSSVPSLQLDNLQSLPPALAQKQTDLTSNDALILPSSLIPANASLSSLNPACCIPPGEPFYSTKSTETRLQKGSSESMQVATPNNRNNFGGQKSTWRTRNRTAKVKPLLKQTGSRGSETVVMQRKKNFKRKRKDNCPGPPRKKVALHRKRKEKNQAEVARESGGPYKLRASKETVRTLKLLPFNSKQLIKCPRRNQPVVVLNHPDADVPEVVNVMKTIAKFKGHVVKVSLSKRTIEALLQPAFCSPLDVTTDTLSQKRHRAIKPISPVKERFVLKLTLKKTSKNNYQIVKTTSDNTLKAKFSCWFCGRIFDNQDNWVGHGQRHLMEATRDWNSLM